MTLMQICVETKKWELRRKDPVIKTRTRIFFFTKLYNKFGQNGF